MYINFSKIFKSQIYVAFVLFLGCKQSNKELIVTRWKLISTNSAINDSAKQRMYKEFIVEFTPEKKYLSGFTYLQETGVYSLSKDEKTITVTFNDNNQRSEAGILKLTSDTLITQSNSDGTTSVFISVKGVIPKPTN